MSGFWGFLKGCLIIQAKAMPRLILSPLVGAVRGAVVTTWEEIGKCDARIKAFQERYLRELEESEQNARAAN